jgi:hypothetical protein
MTSEFTRNTAILAVFAWRPSGRWCEPGIVPGSQAVQLGIVPGSQTVQLGIVPGSQTVQLGIVPGSQAVQLGIVPGSQPVHPGTFDTMPRTEVRGHRGVGRSRVPIAREMVCKPGVPRRLPGASCFTARRGVVSTG